MPRIRGRAAALAAPLLLVAAAGCTSSHAHSPATSAPPTNSAALSTSTPPLPATAPVGTAALAAFLQRGFAAFGSAHLAFSTALSGNALTGSGVVRLAQGQVTAVDVHGTVSQIGAVRYVLAQGTAYAALPAKVAGKTWVHLGGSQTNDELTRAAIGLQATELLAAPATYRTLVRAARAVTLVDRNGLAGRPALHYRGPVDVNRIPTSDQVRLALSALAVARLTVDLWIDGAGRPLQAATASGGRPSEVTFTAINRPVTLAAPPASQVAG